MHWIILVLTIIEEAKQHGTVGNVVVHRKPCEGNKVLAVFESELPPFEANQYNLDIRGDFTIYSTVNLRFDSVATLILSDPMKAQVALVYANIFNVRFLKASPNLRVQVKGPATGTIPYIQSIELDGNEICGKPRTSYFDRYIMGLKGTAEISLKAPDETCGRRKVDQTELIIYGQLTKPGDWPWHVALFRVEGIFVKYICGGTLLSKTLILTAAHCATIRGVPVVPNSLSVILGKHNLIGGDIAPQEREVFEIIVHKSFDAKTLNGDIALLKLKSEALFDDYVQPACLWHRKYHNIQPSGDVYGTVVGWGFNHQDFLSTTLQQISIPLVSDATCLKSNPVFFSKKLNANKFCAGFTNGTSACNGDSGGGLMVFVPDNPGSSGNTAGGWYVRGIVSSTVSRTDAAICDPYQYTLFTDIVNYRDWVTGYMK